MGKTIRNVGVKGKCYVYLTLNGKNIKKMWNKLILIVFGNVKTGY